MNSSKTWTTAVAALTLSVVACSGGQNANVIAPIKPAPTGSAPAGTASKATASVKLSLTIPNRTLTKAHRGRQYVSPSTMSASVLVNGTLSAAFATTATSPDCTAGNNGGTVCSVSITSPVGASQLFTLNTYDGPLTSGGVTSGNLLSTGSATATISTGIANAVNLTLSGVVASLAVSAPVVPVGTATSVPVTVNANDADGNTIVGPGGYIDASGNPFSITLSDSDPSSTTTLAATTLTGPGQTVLLSYSGVAPYGLMPTLTAAGSSSSSSLTSPAYTVDLAPVLVQQPGTFSANLYGGITAGTDNNLYLLEEGASNPIVAKYVPGGGITEYTYTYPNCPAGQNQVSSAQDGITTGTDGKLYFFLTSTCNDSSGSVTQNVGDLVAMTTSGAFSTIPITFASSSTDYVSSLQAIGFSPSGNALINGSTANEGGAFISSTTGGNATAISYQTSLSQYGPNASFEPSGSSLAADSSGNAWIPGYVATQSSTTYVMLKANSSGITAYNIPQPSGQTEQINAVTAASDGNIWYVGTRGSSAIVGKVTSSGQFTDYVIDPGSSANVDYAIADGLNGAVYALIYDYSNGYEIVRVTRSGAITVSPTNGSFGNFGYATRTSNGNIYFDTTIFYQLVY